MCRILRTLLIQTLALTAIASANDGSPILLAKQYGIELWSAPSEAPRDNMSATIIYVRTENPNGQIRSIDRLGIDNVQQLSSRIGEMSYPVGECEWWSWLDTSTCMLDSYLLINQTHFTSDDFAVLETHDETYGDFGLDHLPTMTGFTGGLGSISMEDPMLPMTFQPEFQLNEFEIGWIVAQDDAPTPSVTIGFHWSMNLEPATQYTFFDQVPIVFVPEPLGWQSVCIAFLSILFGRRLGGG